MRKFLLLVVCVASHIVASTAPLEEEVSDTPLTADQILAAIKSVSLLDGRSFLGEEMPIAQRIDYMPYSTDKNTSDIWWEIAAMLENPIKEKGWFSNTYHHINSFSSRYNKIVFYSNHLNPSILMMLAISFEGGKFFRNNLRGLEAQPERAHIFKELYQWRVGETKDATRAFLLIKQERERIAFASQNEEYFSSSTVVQNPTIKFNLELSDWKMIIKDADTSRRVAWNIMDQVALIDGRSLSGKLCSIPHEEMDWGYQNDSETPLLKIKFCYMVDNPNKVYDSYYSASDYSMPYSRLVSALHHMDVSALSFFTTVLETGKLYGIEFPELSAQSERAALLGELYQWRLGRIAKPEQVFRSIQERRKEVCSLIKERARNSLKLVSSQSSAVVKPPTVYTLDDQTVYAQIRNGFVWGTFKYPLSLNERFSTICGQGELDLSFDGKYRSINDEDIALCSQTAGYEAITTLKLSGNKDITDAALKTLYESSIGSSRQIPQRDYNSGKEISVVTLIVDGTSITDEGIRSFNKVLKSPFSVNYFVIVDWGRNRLWKTNDAAIRAFVIKR